MLTWKTSSPLGNFKNLSNAKFRKLFPIKNCYKGILFPWMEFKKIKFFCSFLFPFNIFYHESVQNWDKWYSDIFYFVDVDFLGSARFSDSPLIFRQPIILTSHCSDTPLFRQPVFPKADFILNSNSHSWRFLCLNVVKCCWAARKHADLSLASVRLHSDSPLFRQLVIPTNWDFRP